MANYQSLKAAINAVIKANGNKEITGTVLNEVLLAMVNSLGADYQFAGVATPSTNPGTPDQNVFYLAGKGGTYSNFNNIVLPDGVSILMWNGSWSSQTVLAGDGGVFDISYYKAIGGTLAKFTDLAAALDGGNNVPVDVRSGGMQVRFVKSSDNKYVQYRLMADTFNTTEANWQGVDDEPNAGSDNLVKSGGIVTKYGKLNDFAIGIQAKNWNQGYIRSDGTVDNEDIKSVYCPDYFSVFEGNLYKITNLSGYKVTWYFYNNDASYNSMGFWFGHDSEVTIPSGIAFIRFSLRKDDGTDIDASIFTFILNIDGFIYITNNNIERIDNELKTSCILLKNKEATSTVRDIKIPISVIKGETYNLSFTRSIAWNVLTISLYNGYEFVQDIFSGKIGANVETYRTFIAQDNATLLVIKDTKNDSAEYNITLTSKHSRFDLIKDEILQLSDDIEKHEFEITQIENELDDIIIEGLDEEISTTEINLDGSDFTQGAVNNNSFPQINLTNNRITLLQYINIAKLNLNLDGEVSEVCLNVGSDKNFGLVQYNVGESGTGLDSGWKGSGTYIGISRNDISFNVRYSNNEDISPSDISSITIGVKYRKYKRVLKDSNDEVLKVAAKTNFLATKPLTVVCHASSSFVGYETNTLLSIMQAIENGYEALENDVRMTSDNVPILYHDDTITVNGQTAAIETFTFAQLSTFTYPSGQGICTLEEELKLCKNNNIYLINELKSSNNSAEYVDSLWTSEKINIVMNMLVQYLGYEMFAITAVSEHLLNRIRTNNNNVTLLYITYRDTYKPNLNTLALSKGNSWLYLDYAASVDANDQYHYQDYIANAISLGIPIGCWTPTVLDCIRIANDNYTKVITSNTYIDTPSSRIIYTYNSKNTFATTNKVTHNGTITPDGFLKLSVGQELSCWVDNLYSGSVVIEIAFKGSLDFASLDRGMGGIAHPDGTRFGSGSYKYGIVVGKNSYVNQKINFNPSEETIIYKFDVVESGVLNE